MARKTRRWENRGAGPAPPGPSPTTPKKPSRGTRTLRSPTLSPGPSPTTPKKPSRGTRTLRSPTLSPGKKDDPPLPPIPEGTLPDVEDDAGIPEDVDEQENIAAQLLEYSTDLLSRSNAGLAAAPVNEKYWRAVADTFGVLIKPLRRQSTSKERYIRLSTDFNATQILALWRTE
ncbi:hypothetical protein NX059_012330 [Plenodomus lindquistii]|nr:hypothetical protein NX059_012330 [Plenodomus lindquistii]